MDEGNDLILAFDSRVSDEMRDLASDMGVEVEPKGSAVTDHFSYATGLPGSGTHTIVAATETTKSKAVLDSALEVRGAA